MNIFAKQVNNIDVHNKMDNTSVLGFFGQIKSVILSFSALVTALGNLWTAFVNAVAAYDNAYAQTRMWMQTDELEVLDKTRDKAVRAFMNALKALVASPNAEKAAAAKRVQFTRDKYTVDAEDEYMKETTAISQMIQDMEANCQADLALTGLDEWFTDLKLKNEAFLAKMNERTEEQSGMQKGIVRDTRLQAEEAFRNLVKVINAMAICEYPAGLDFNAPIDRLNAEIEHYRQILARKGISTGSNANGGQQSGGQQSGDNGQQSGGQQGGDNGGQQGGDNSGQQGGDNGGQQGGDNGGDNGGQQGGGTTPVNPDPGTGGGGGDDLDPTNSED